MQSTHTDTWKWVGLAGWVYNYLNASTIIRMVGRPNNGPTRAAAAAKAVAVAGALAIPSGAICDTQSRAAAETIAPHNVATGRPRRLSVV